MPVKSDINSGRAMDDHSLDVEIFFFFFFAGVIGDFTNKWMRLHCLHVSECSAHYARHTSCFRRCLSISAYLIIAGEWIHDSLMVLNCKWTQKKATYKVGYNIVQTPPPLLILKRSSSEIWWIQNWTFLFYSFCTDIALILFFLIVFILAMSQLFFFFTKAEPRDWTRNLYG